MFPTFLLLLLMTALADAKGFPESPADYASHPRTKRAIVCYEDLGCFDNGPPFWSFCRPLSLQPESPDEIRTEFHLFTRKETLGRLIPATALSNVASTDFKGSRPTKFIVHGWKETTLRERYFIVKNELLTEGDYNVFLVDWQNGAKKEYRQAVANARVAGAQIARLIKHLKNRLRPMLSAWAAGDSGSQRVKRARFSVVKDTQGAKPEDMHIIGHSLGSHVAGYAGALTPRLARITALDPAWLYFQYTDPVVRLDPTDAAFVDVIHTFGGSIKKPYLGLGMSQPAGHVDFYPNGGHEQPGCPCAIADTIEAFSEDAPSCNHARSVQLFIDTIKAGKCPYRAYQCESADDFNNGKCIPCTGTGCGIMGMHADQARPADGATNVKYFFYTGNDAPYCRFHYKVTLTFLAGKGEEQQGRLYVSLAGSDASTGMIQVTKDPIFIYPGQTYSYVVTSPDELGDVGKVTFRWVHHAAFKNGWNSWDDWSTLAVYLREVQVYSGEAQKGVSFCAGDVKVKSNTDLTVYNTC